MTWREFAKSEEYRTIDELAVVDENGVEADINDDSEIISANSDGGYTEVMIRR